MHASLPDSDETITVNFKGQLTLSRAVLRELLHQPPLASAFSPPRTAGALDRVDGEGKVPRLAYSMKETAEILGLNYFTVQRLLKRGQLRSSVALRTKLIARKEIERFLKTTTTAC